MRVHVVALPHTLLTDDYAWCAYTMKVKRFIAMLAQGGHEPLVYGPDVHDTPQATDYVVISDEDDRRSWFGAREWDANRVFDIWQSASEPWRVTCFRAAKAIRARWQDGDVLGIIAGQCQQQLVLDLSDLEPLVCEWGIGYSGVLPNSHKVWESHAWAHHVAGLQHDDNARFFDRVVPNCFDPDEFTPSTTPGEYLLFVGRPNERKGLPIVRAIAERTDIPVVVAGQPGHDIPGATYVGVVRGKDKAELFAHALVTLAPTTYLEPFGGVAVESQMSGTPVISTDWGAFTETVEPGIGGYRCHTLRDFLHAIDLAPGIDRAQLIRRAHDRWSTTTGAQLYSAYLNDLATLYSDGWYAA